VTTPEELKKYVRDVPDYPQKGIIFRDITPLLGDKKVFAEVVDLMSRAWTANPPDLVAAIEARGFIPGAAMAVKLGAGFVPIRKTGKLPWTTVMESYDLEYGTDSLEVHSDAIQPGQSVLIVDDVLATGGTAAATARLVEKVGGTVAGFGFVLELDFLSGRKKLDRYQIHSLLHY
jgi:adenine phosphoribosyltransferase